MESVASRARGILEEFGAQSKSFGSMVWAFTSLCRGRDCVELLGEERRQGEDPYAIGGGAWAPIAACERARQVTHALLWLASLSLGMGWPP